MEYTKVHGVGIRQGEFDQADALTNEQLDAVLEWNCGTAEVNFHFQSAIKSVRALEYMDFLLDDCGMVKGDGNLATGLISNTLMNMLVSKNDVSSVEEYLIKKTNEYYEECVWIYASQFDAKAFANELKEYRKKQVPWAYVKTTWIGNPGEEILFKTLENESGVHVSIADDVYMMVGCRGEVYHIDAKKFANTYVETEENLDVFKQMLDFIPEIQMVESGEFISLDEKAKICYANPANTILAMPLGKYTKVFYGEHEEDYFVGRPGDYLVVRKDDLHDVYIIKNNVFLQTYENV